MFLFSGRPGMGRDGASLAAPAGFEKGTSRDKYRHAPLTRDNQFPISR